MLEFRRMQPEDLDEVAAIEKTLFSCPWSKNSFEISLDKEYILFLTAIWDGKIAGYCGFLRSFDEADIVNVGVAKEYQGRGIACAMLKELMRLGNEIGVKDFTLEVRVSNAPAIHVYEKLGFVNEGIRKNFYEKPKEDAMIMWKRSMV